MKYYLLGNLKFYFIFQKLVNESTSVISCYASLIFYCQFRCSFAYGLQLSSQNLTISFSNNKNIGNIAKESESLIEGNWKI